jgi:hypothetical protein
VVPQRSTLYSPLGCPQPSIPCSMNRAWHRFSKESSGNLESKSAILQKEGTAGTLQKWGDSGPILAHK